MRKFLLLAISFAIITPCHAAIHSVTVEQLKQMLAAQQTANKNDGALAEQLSSLELSEQLTQPTLDRITAEFKPGPKATLSLKLLADASTFLEPPAAEKRRNATTRGAVCNSLMFPTLPLSMRKGGLPAVLWTLRVRPPPCEAVRTGPLAGYW